MPPTRTQSKNKSFSPNKSTVVDFVTGFILINHLGKLLKKCAIPSIEELRQRCKKKTRQYSAFMVFRCILSPNFKLKYGEASIFYGKLWSKVTPTLKAEMTCLSETVKSKLKENIVFKHYNQDGKSSTDDSMADSTTDANSITTDEASSIEREFSNDSNTFAGDASNEYVDTHFIDHTNPPPLPL
ncbi:11505_t:CDS:1 [Paraglomus brasilianum]|uniref:11505_t:CDS:1 n=1 Tax=Paraglomus brasilianum TaxID=144538 RepID=A0A9N8ZY95_9GLOM|nr:11505_t:CDS:1 [Paraglomus brasilianum]